MTDLIDIHHNILWSKYKGQVFSRLHELAPDNIRFFQIAETDTDRTSIGGVDLSYHTYPFTLLFKGSYGATPTWQLLQRTFSAVWNSDARLIVLPGYHKVEYWGMLLAAILRRKKRATFCDSTIYDQKQIFWKGVLKRLFFRCCDGFFSYGERSRAYLLRYGVPEHKVFHRCQAAALRHDYSPERALERRLAQVSTPQAPRFLYVGRLSSEKSLDVLLAAFAQVVKDLPDAHLVLVGSGPQKEMLADQTSSLGLTRAVTFAGSMNPIQLGEEYSKATCLVLPSISEAWGLVVNEALSFGCPVVVSNRCGCVPELVEEKATGLVFRAGNVDDLARALKTAPAKFADFEGIGRQCLTLISAFSPDAAASAILRGCRKMLLVP